MNTHIKTYGKILFDPPHATTKHHKQGSWKRTAMVIIDDDLCEYYSWHLLKRYNLSLLPPLRKSHVTFINDRFDNNALWNDVKTKWNGKTIEVVLSVDFRTNGNHWYLNVPEEHHSNFDTIRNELNLGKPYYKYHLTIGYPNSKQIDHSEYIHQLLKNGYAS